MTAEEYREKEDAQQEAAIDLIRHKITQQEFDEKFGFSLEKPLPDNVEDIIMDMCEHSRGDFNLTLDGKLKLLSYSVFKEDPKMVYALFDTVFHGEYDNDETVVGFPIEIFYDENLRRDFCQKRHCEFLRLEDIRKKKQLKDIDKWNFKRKFEKAINEEGQLRREQEFYASIRKKYLKDEFEWIADAFIKRGLLEPEYRQDYINYLKIDLI